MVVAEFDWILGIAQTIRVVTLTVNADATEVVVHTGLSCDAVARPVDVHIALPDLTTTVVDAP